MLLEKNPNIRPSITDISEFSIVKKNIHKYVFNEKSQYEKLDKLKDFKTKFELNVKEFDSKISNQNNYPSNTSTTTTDILSPQINSIPTPGKINLQTYALVKEKFNSYKVYFSLSIERHSKRQKILS
jgi:hypothetical protein